VSLVLARRTGESIMIGDSIEVTVLYISQHQVKIGVRAPADVRVDRHEVYLRRKNEEEAKDGERQE